MEGSYAVRHVPSAIFRKDESSFSLTRERFGMNSTVHPASTRAAASWGLRGVYDLGPTGAASCRAHAGTAVLSGAISAP